MFCAPTLMFCALPNDSVTIAIAVKGGMITTSTSDMSPRSSSNDSTNRPDSACVMFIFQFAAMIFLRMSNQWSDGVMEWWSIGGRIIPLLQCSSTPLLLVGYGRHARKLLPFEQFERCAAAGRNEGH